ncbi:MAG: hypothetical protein Q9196_005805 [Gyalolechia fulgens]
MASRLDWLRTCKLSQLGTIARAIGTNSSGTRRVLIPQIQHSLSPLEENDSPTANGVSKSRPKKRKHGYNILSIDMGIRNLAYCHLTLPHTWLLPSSPPPEKKQQPAEPVIPALTSWARIDVSRTSPIRLSTTTTITDPLPVRKESFQPPLYARYAHNFITTSILPLNPTHILIERQRFRSMGGTAVQEWTLRVNMFESMLYATLHTLQQQGRWKGEVVPMDPSKVSRFWVNGEELVEGKGRERDKGEKTKKRKMGIAREIVRKGEEVKVEGMAREVVEQVAGVEGVKERNKAENGVGKFDDLADCLLQGLAWVKWEENKRWVWEKGTDVLDHWKPRVSKEAPPD